MLGFNFNWIDITKKETNSLDIKSVKKKLNELESYPKRNFDTLHLTFGGYDDDVREIYEIEEIRSWCTKVVKECPHILFYLEDKNFSLTNIIISISDFKSLQPGPRKSIVEWHLSGADSLEDLPEVRIEVFLDKCIFKEIEAKLIDYGKKINQVEKVKSKIDRINHFVKY